MKEANGLQSGKQHEDIVFGSDCKDESYGLGMSLFISLAAEVEWRDHFPMPSLDPYFLRVSFRLSTMLVE